MSQPISARDGSASKCLEGLVRNGVTVTRGHTLQAQLICAGEYKLGIELYLYTAAQMQRTGCPINIVYPNPTTVASAQSWAILVTAPHPHAAALFVDYILSAEGAELVADYGRIPARTSVKPKFETLNQLASGTVSVQVLTPEDAHRLRQPADSYSKTSCFADDTRSFCFPYFSSAAIEPRANSNFK